MEKQELLRKLHNLASYLKEGKITLENFDKLAMLEVYRIDTKTLKQALNNIK